MTTHGRITLVFVDDGAWARERFAQRRLIAPWHARPS